MPTNTTTIPRVISKRFQWKLSNLIREYDCGSGLSFMV